MKEQQIKEEEERKVESFSSIMHFPTPYFHCSIIFREYIIYDDVVNGTAENLYVFYVVSCFSFCFKDYVIINLKESILEVKGIL